MKYFLRQVFRVLFSLLKLRPMWKGIQFDVYVNGLPEPRRSLLTTMSREAIAAANQEVQKELNVTKNMANTRSILQPSVLIFIFI